jgi:hypothetical protein
MGSPHGALPHDPLPQHPASSPVASARAGIIVFRIVVAPLFSKCLNPVGTTRILIYLAPKGKPKKARTAQRALWYN